MPSIPKSNPYMPSADSPKCPGYQVPRNKKKKKLVP